MNYMSDKPVVADPWQGFSDGEWRNKIDVRGFIQENYTPYEGDDSFLADATDRTKQLWEELGVLLKKEREAGVLDVSAIPTSIAAHDAGYINKDLEVIGWSADRCSSQNARSCQTVVCAWLKVVWKHSASNLIRRFMKSGPNTAKTITRVFSTYTAQTSWLAVSLVLSPVFLMLMAAAASSATIAALLFMASTS